jgi:hypothetical protein
VEDKYEDEEIWALYAAEDLCDEFLDACPRGKPTRDEFETLLRYIALVFSEDLTQSPTVWLRQAASILREASDELERQAMEDEGKDENEE